MADTDLAHRPYRYRHGWIKLITGDTSPPGGKWHGLDGKWHGLDGKGGAGNIGDLRAERKAYAKEVKAAKQTADVDLLHRVRTGNASKAEKAEVARRGGLSYLDLPPKEFVKSERDQDKSKADPARAEALYQRGQETARARAARRNKGSEAEPKTAHQIRANRIYRNSPEGRKALAKQERDRHNDAMLNAWSKTQRAKGPQPLKTESAAQAVRRAKNPSATTNRERVRHMSDNQVRDFVELGEKGVIDGALAKAAAAEHRRRRHHVPEMVASKPVTKQQVDAETDARREYERLNSKYPSKDPRVKAALAKWQHAMLMNGGPVSQGEADLAPAGARHTHPSHDDIKRYEHGFSAPEGNDMDMDLAKQRAPRPPGPRVIHPKGPLQRAARNFRQTMGGQKVLAKRASQPGHFRAKAILAAQSGKPQMAKRLLAKSAAARARRTVAKPATHPAKVVHPNAPRPASPKGNRVPKPRGPRGPRKVRNLSVDAEGRLLDLAKPGQRYTHGWVPIGASAIGEMVDTSDFKSQLVPTGGKRRAAKRARLSAKRAQAKAHVARHRSALRAGRLATLLELDGIL